MKTKTEIAQQADAIAQKVEAASPDDRFRTYFDGVRQSDIPFLPCELQKQAGELYRLSYCAFYRLARASVPHTVGFTMHQYNLAALATLPVPLAPDFERRRQVLVDAIKRYRSLMAISSYGDQSRAKGEIRNVTITPQGKGSYVCSGTKGFQSIVSEADLLLFSGYFGEEFGLFYTNLKGQPALEMGPSLFAGAMAGSDTRPLRFNDLVIKERNVLSTTTQLTEHVVSYGTAWFEALVTAAYLGGACRALNEARKFAFSVLIDGETPLASIDGFRVDFARLVMKLRSSLVLANSFGTVVERYCQGVRENIPSEELDSIVEDLSDCAGVIKYTATQAAVDIVAGARALVGTRAMHVNHPIYALNEQICFGPLHPTIQADLEREAADQFLTEEPFDGLFHHGLE